jgi:hypothetical protein
VRTSAIKEGFLEEVVLPGVRMDELYLVENPSE